MIPRSFDVEDGSSFLSMRVKVTCKIVDSTCGTRNSTILVLEGLMRTRITQHHAKTRLRSWFTLTNGVSSLFRENSKESLKSSTKHSILQLCYTVSTWLTYKLNSKGPRINPCDSPDSCAEGWREPMRTDCFVPER